MKRLVFAILALVVTFAVSAQSENSIIIDQSSFRAVQTDALTGVAIDPISVDSSRRPCARLKVKINRMTKEEIAGIELRIRTNNQLTKNLTAEYDTGLIVELTALPTTRFCFYHKEFGYSNEVELPLEGNKEYYLEASLNQTFSIVVDSNVEGAEVYVDDTFKGRTDSSFRLTVNDILIGHHKLCVVYGNARHEKSIDVNKNSIFFRQDVNTQISEPQFVVFAVNPVNAVVIINNQHYVVQDGVAQLVLTPGTYSYTVTAAGYHSQNGTFTVAGEKVVKNINLKADAATVTLSVQDNAEIWINGEKKGVGSWKGMLNSGIYIFEAKKEGYRTTTFSKTITATQPQQNYVLSAPVPIYGTLVLVGTAMADVTIDGQKVGQTPIKLNAILVGNHKVVVSKPGYNSITRNITIKEGQVEEINIALIERKNSYAESSNNYNSRYKKYRSWDSFNLGVFAGMGVECFEGSIEFNAGLLWRLWSYNSLFNVMTGVTYMRTVGADFISIPAVLNCTMRTSLYIGIGTELTIVPHPYVKNAYDGSYQKFPGVMFTKKGAAIDFPLVFQVGWGFRHHDVNMYMKCYGLSDFYEGGLTIFGIRYAYLF